MKKSLIHLKGQFQKHPAVSAFLLFMLVISVFFMQPILRGEAVSPSDMIYIYDNYSYLVEDDYVPSNELLSDQTLQFEPWKMYAREQIRQGKLPWENPYQADGAPLIGNDQSAVFFPTNIIFYLLEVNFASTLGVLIRLIFAAFGMYLLLTALKIKREFALLGGLIFAFAGFNIVWLSHPHSNVSIFLPWLLWVTHQLTELEISRRNRIKHSLLLTVLILLQFLGGHVETSFNICFVTGIYFMYRILAATSFRKIQIKSLVRQSALYALPIFAGLLLASIQLVPFLSYLKESYVLESRSGVETNTYGQPPAAALTWFVPNIYGNPRDDIYTHAFPTLSLDKGFELTFAPLTNYNESVQGFAGLIFIIIAPLALLAKKYRSLVILLIALNIFILLMSLRIWPIFQLVTEIPPFDLAPNHRLLLLFGMNNIILGVIALQYIFRGEGVFHRIPSNYRYAGIVFFMGLLILCASLLVYVTESQLLSIALVDQLMIIGSDLRADAIAMVNYSMKQILISAILLISFLLVILLYSGGKLSRWHATAIIFIIFAIDIVSYAYNYNPSYDLNSRFPVTPGIQFLQENTTEERVLFIDTTLPPNIATQYKIHDLRSYDAMGEKQFTERFYEAYSPQGPWELIQYLPDMEVVASNNEKYDFNVKYIAIGTGSEMAEQFQEKYNHRIVFRGSDMLVALVEND
ncbi:MAG: hypothetical protein QY318_03330 [Candidatus Dojkabacteria bacterium]|nr:MAG: hypothetical protein QY318_03330 [Candidatus Dojkabacteria bacterium]